MKRLSAFAGSLLACTVLLFGVAQAEIKDRTLRFAFVNNVGHPQEQGAKKFADLVAERSGGKIKVRSSPAASSAATCRSSRRCKAATSST